MDRIELGTLNYSFMHHDLAQILRQPVRSTSNYAERFNVRYVWTDILDEAPAVLDERRIAQVMVNLLSNAAKFSQSGGQVDLGLHATGRALPHFRTRLRPRHPAGDEGKGLRNLHAR